MILCPSRLLADLDSITDSQTHIIFSKKVEFIGHAPALSPAKKTTKGIWVRVKTHVFVGEGSAVGLESAPGEVGVRSPACCWNGSGKESKFGITPSGEYLFELKQRTH